MAAVFERIFSGWGLFPGSLFAAGRKSGGYTELYLDSAEEG
jgi:hypothetical protein